MTTSNHSTNRNCMPYRQTVKKYDPVKMKKNLDDNKKRLAEKTSAAEVLQK